MLKIQFKDRRKPALWLVDSVLKIGSDARCDIRIDSDQVAPIHCELDIKDHDITLTNVSGNRSIFVNDIPIVKQTRLNAWDIIRMGDTELEIIDPLTERTPPPQKESPKTVVRPAVSPWMLKAVSPPLDGQYFNLSHGNVIGRDERGDIVVPLDYVSRQHVKVAIRNDKLYVEDLNSSNGTFVNDEKVKSAELRAGDILRLDEFRFQVVGPTPGNPSAPRTIVRDGAPVRKSNGDTSRKTNNKRTVKLPKVFLHGLSEQVAGKVFEIDKARNHISRMLGHHMSTSERSVSARHVYINATENGWEIKNEGAADGLLINDKMQIQALLQDGDILTIGGFKLYFQGSGQAPIKLPSQQQKRNRKIGVWVAVAMLVVGAAIAVLELL